MRVAAYCRISTNHEENAKSLETQIQYYLDTIVNKPGWELIGIYADKGISGTSLKNRHAFNRLIRHCQEGKIDYILTKSISRFARNTADFLQVLRLLRQHHVDIYFEKEGLRLSEAKNEFMLTIFAAVAQSEAVTLAENIEWSMERRFLSGQAKSAPILGYNMYRRLGEKIIELDEAEATVVRNIFQMFLTGYSLTDISRHLIENKIKTKAGHLNWYTNQVKYILSNQRYTGDVLTKPKPSSLTDIRSQIDRKPILIKRAYPSIIDHSTYEQVQQKLKANKRGTPAKAKKHLLTSRVVCGRCGQNYSQYYLVGGSRVWRCSLKASNQLLCQSPLIPEGSIVLLLKQAFEKRFGHGGVNQVQKLVDQLDIQLIMANLEKERLRLICDIVDAKKAFEINPDDQTEKLIHTKERDYVHFETKAQQLEEDQLLMQNAAEKALRLINLPSITEQLDLPFLRGFIRKITLFTQTDAIINWIDGQDTSVGQLSVIKETLANTTTAPAKTKAERQIRRQRSSSKQVSDVLFSLNKKDFKSLYCQLTSGQTGRRVCAYCRVSTEEEKQINSLAIQITYYVQLIMSNPDWIFSGIYFDAGFSGTKADNRPEFMRMIQACEAGQIDRIICKSVSRFSRNVVDCLSYTRRLAHLSKPVSVYFENEKIDSLSLKGDMALSIFAGLAQEESRNISENTKWSRIRQVERGNYRHSGKVNYGYQLDNHGYWQIDEKQAAVVREIFQSVIDGVSFAKIARSLVERQIPNSQGKARWYVGVIGLMVDNYAYTGDLVYQKTYVKDYLTHKIGKNRGELPKYVMENHHAPIISHEIWEKAQTSLNQRRNVSTETKKKHDHPEFTKLLICADCGSILTHHISIGSKVIHHWRCRAAGGNKNHIQCQAKSIREESIEYLFMVAMQIYQQDQSWVDQAKEYIAKIELTQKDIYDMQELGKLIHQKYKKLHHLCNHQTADHLSNHKGVSELTENIFLLKSKHNQYHDRLQDAEDLKRKLAWIRKVLAQQVLFNPETNKPVYNSMLFEYFVISSIVSDTYIIFNLAFNLSIKLNLPNKQVKKNIYV